MIIAMSIIAGLFAYIAIGFGVGYWAIMSERGTHSEYREGFKFALFLWPIFLIYLIASGVNELLNVAIQRIIDRKEREETEE